MFFKNKKITKKHLFFGAFALLIPLFVFLLLTSDTRKFRSFTDQLFCSELSRNTLSMHYTVANPENFGLEQVSATLPVYAPGTKDTQALQVAQTLDFLDGISFDRLSSSDQKIYALLSAHFENELGAKDLFYYDEPLSPSSGMQTQLPVLLAEYTFRSAKDVEDYLKLLDCTDEYFGGLLVYEREKAAAGLFMSDASAKKVVEQCDTIMDTSLLESGTHFLQTTFTERLALLQEQGLLTEEEIAQYTSENNRLLKTVMAPAYTALGDGIFVLMGKGTNDGGLAGFPNGREFYSYLLRRDVGCYRDMKEIKSMICEDFSTNMDALVTLTSENPNALAHAENGHFENILPFENAESMLAFLEQRMQKDFPALPNPVPYSVKSISESLADYSSPAFYLTPPLDDINNNAIYLNPNNHYGKLDMFTTLAHEGYPGHLYQCVYNNSKPSSKQNPILSLLGCVGYAEGYALYVELISYDYAKEIAENAGNTEAAQYYEILKTDRKVQLGLYALLDVAIHYEGADFETIQSFLSSVGITNEDACRNVYEYIAEEPANYLRYYLGYLEILSLKEKAATLWGDDFNDYKFHTFLLDAGPADFKHLNAWLDDTE